MFKVNETKAPNPVESPICVIQNPLSRFFNQLPPGNNVIKNMPALLMNGCEVFAVGSITGNKRLIRCRTGNQHMTSCIGQTNFIPVAGVKPIVAPRSQPGTSIGRSERNRKANQHITDNRTAGRVGNRYGNQPSVGGQEHRTG